jgi:hypothetical protein
MKNLNTFSTDIFYNFKSVLSFFLLTFIISGCGSSGGGSTTYNPRNPIGAGPAAIPLGASGASVVAGDLGASGNYVILSQAGISNVTGSAITGNMGVSPAAATYITGFALVADGTNVFSTSSSVTGKIYAANYAVPTPSNLTSAISSMQTAYTEAASRTNPDFNELLTGNIGGQTLAPGLYKWTSSVTIPNNVTISGTANDIWIFQISGNLTMSAAKNIILAGGALAKNIYWQIAGTVTLGTSSHFEGIILCKTAVTLQTTASMNGQIFSQTMVALDNNSVVKP